MWLYGVLFPIFYYSALLFISGYIFFKSWTILFYTLRLQWSNNNEQEKEKAMYTPVSGNINTVGCVNRVFEDWFSKRPRGGLQLRKIRAENAAGPVSVLGSSDVVSACFFFHSVSLKKYQDCLSLSFSLSNVIYKLNKVHKEFHNIIKYLKKFNKMLKSTYAF